MRLGFGADRILRAAAYVLLAAGWLALLGLLWQTAALPADLIRPELDLANFVPQDQLDEAARYQSFLRIDLLAASVAQLAALAFFAVKGHAYMRESAAGPIATGMLLGMLAMAFAWLARFPFSLAAHWWERRHDLTELGYFDFAVGDFLSVGSTFLYVSLVLLVVMAAAVRWPRHWLVSALPALLAIGVLLAFAQPYLLPGLESPRDSRIDADVRELAEAQGIGTPEVRIQETYDITNAPNAGAAGVGSSGRIILRDNLVEGFPRNEIKFVLAHELAHLSRGHIWKQLALLGLLAVPIALAAARVTRPRGGMGEPRVVPVAIFVVAMLLVVFAPLRAAFSQRLEAEADWIALETTRDPDAAIGLMRGFVDDGLAAPKHPPWSAVFFETHPSIDERIELAEGWRQRADSTR